MFVLPVLTAIGASAGWACGIVLAQTPARALGAFEFTRIQLIACSAVMAALCTVFDLWPSIAWDYWPHFAASSAFGVVLSNLAMIACLRRGGARRTELLLALKAPIAVVLAFLWLGEVLTGPDLAGIAMALSGVVIAVQANRDEGLETKPGTAGLVAIIGFGLASAACQAAGFLLLKPAMAAGTEPLAAAALRLLGAAFIISIASIWPTAAVRRGAELTPPLLVQTLVPGIIGYVVASSFLIYAFATLNAGIAAVLGSLSPVFVLFVLWLKQRRMPNRQALVGASVTVSGIAVILLY
ncbi:DMT family transporter [Roseibium sp. RKSG952]|uniref:DMT family transporter n=1 Tax=Roseibium sp. RKSG952 TaxID=2529384 RepID=UPI0012BB8DE1|nr:DMT family transporter [Roseibium sp. RKSG952]MTH98236.1 DMT family transporter [Roseibium sp. RKSG952]